MADEVNWAAERRMSPVLDMMFKAGVKPTRESYIANAYPDLAPEDWTDEHEAELPEPFRKEA